MWEAIKRFFGYVEHEIEDIVADFHIAITRLESLVERKNQTAADKQAEATAAQAAAELAVKQAADAVAIRDNLAALVVPK